VDEPHDERRTAPAVREYHNRPHRPGHPQPVLDNIGLARRLHAAGQPRHLIAEICACRSDVALELLLAGYNPWTRR